MFNSFEGDVIWFGFQKGSQKQQGNFEKQEGSRKNNKDLIWGDVLLFFQVMILKGGILSSKKVESWFQKDNFSTMGVMLNMKEFSA